ncbi:uncharacterized protein LOC106708290 [Papilio machaon]|uniref:uncharacterized protein LOC106708290 n=1 Tax=Papilio machaon TaxID=76193 RepID=UPI001E66486A|nr:uncharacterized protein LOC106708290 [Papilio machaon]
MNSDKRAPIILKKNNISLFKRNCLTRDSTLFQCMNKANSVVVKEDVIYTSTPGDFLKGEYPDLIIINRLNIFTNSSRTTAKYRCGASSIIERTSDEVTKLIGQKNYDTLFAALCSVISQEYRIQGILALLTVQKSNKTVSCQSDITNSDTRVELSNISCQTDETCFDLIQRLKQKRKIRKPQQTPYVVQEPNKVKKLVIIPKHFKDTRRIIDIEEKLKKENTDNPAEESLDQDNEYINEKETVCALKFPLENSACVEKATNNVLKDSGQAIKTESGNETSFPELRQFVDEDSNISDISCGKISINSLGIPNLVDNPIDILVNIDKHTQESVSQQGTTLTMLDGTQVGIHGTFEDYFHIAKAETLKTLSPSERSKVMWYQAYIDWKLCLVKDEDGNLPIHMAVLSNDIDLLRRQCVVLKSRQESVDLPASGNVTALQMSISQDYASCTAVLLQYGANPLVTDDDQRTAVHLAAEMSPDHLKAIINCCRNNARYILEENDCWKPEFDTMTPEDLAKYLLSKVYLMYDSQGYTPLMLASKQGNYANVELLLESDTSTVNLPMPNCGNTALYEAAAAACIDAEKRSNKSQIAENYLKTIETLIKLGADPSIENCSGHSVNHLLNEISNRELSMLVANTIVSLKYSDYDSDLKKDFKSFMLVKEQDGDVTVKELNKEKIQITSKDNVKISPIAKQKVTPSRKIIPVDKNDFINKTSSKIKKHVIIPYDKTIKRKVDQEGGNVGVSTEVNKNKKIKNIIIVPAQSGSGYVKNIKNMTEINKIQSNQIHKRKILKVSRIDLNNAINSLNVSNANVIGNNVISISNTTTAKKTQSTNEPTNTALPIKKQKRDIQN